MNTKRCIIKQRSTQNPHKYFEVNSTINQQQCKILYDSVWFLRPSWKHVNKLNKTPFLSLQTLDFGFSIPNYLKNVSDPLSSEKSPYLILLKFVFRDSVFCEYKVISPFFNMSLPNYECAPPSQKKKKISIDIYLQFKTSFILYDDEVNFLKSIQKLRLIV